MISSVPHVIPPVKNIRVDILFKRSKIEYSVSEYVRKLSSKVIWGTTKDMNFHTIVVEKKKKYRMRKWPELRGWLSVEVTHFY